VAEAAEKQGSTPTAPARRWLRRSATVLLAALPLAGLLPAAGAEAAPAAPAAHTAPAVPSASSASSASSSSASARAVSATGTGSRTAEVAVNTLSPTAPGKDDTLNITGTVTNHGRSAILGGKVGLRAGPLLEHRSSIDAAAGRTGFRPDSDGTEVKGGDATTGIGTVRPGDRRHFRLSVPVSDLKLKGSGVYQLGVALSGHSQRHPYDRVLGIARTFLPWQRGSVEKKTELTYLWPLISSAHLTARTESDEQQTPVFGDDRLAKELAPGGRLQQLVDLGKDLPVTWVVDPDLLATVEAMTGPYRVEKPGGGTKAGTGQKYAKQWLNDLKNAVKGEQVAALPFADPDLASLAHRGKNVPGALGHLRPATQRGAKAVESILYTKPTTEYAWPVDGAVDSSIADVATSAGAHNIIARSDSLRDPALPYTPTAARPVGGGTTALVADSRLSQAFEGDLSEPGASSKAVQRFLAETQSINAEAPTKQRSILVAPQRTPTAAQARAMAQALSSLRKDGRWTEDSSLTDAAEAKPDPRANTRLPGLRQYPASLRRQELPTRAYEQMHSTQSVLNDFQQVLTKNDRVITPFGSSMEREVSNSWRGDPRGAKHFRDSVRDYLVGLTKKVKLIQKSTVTLSGRSATIPVTVQNNLVQGVDGLRLKLTSSRRIGLEVSKSQPVRVDGGHSQSVKFDATAKANGRAYVVAQLYTKDGKPYGKPMRFRVNVTSITSAVLLVIAGGVLLVVLAGVRMYTTRKRKSPGGDSDPDAAGEEPPEPEPGDGGEDGGESGPETGTESGSGADAEAAAGPHAAAAAGHVEESGTPPDASEKVDR